MLDANGRRQRQTMHSGSTLQFLFILAIIFSLSLPLSRFLPRAFPSLSPLSKDFFSLRVHRERAWRFFPLAFCLCFSLLLLLVLFVRIRRFFTYSLLNYFVLLVAHTASGLGRALSALLLRPLPAEDSCICWPKETIAKVHTNAERASVRRCIDESSERMNNNQQQRAGDGILSLLFVSFRFAGSRLISASFAPVRRPRRTDDSY